MNKPSYRGRFAPSPTGDLHLGSLLAALVSFFQARANNGCWLLRIEDIDETRVVDGAAEQIIKTLACFGLQSDEPVIYQTHSDRQAAYQKTFQQLGQKNLTYPCSCSRKQLSGNSIYPGTCRNLKHQSDSLQSTRLKTNQQVFQFNDIFQGEQSQPIDAYSGDFNIKRKDGLFCYQLAVVVDDADQGITEVVRGIDIMDSTSRQMLLIELMEFTQPNYAHFPVLVNHTGEKLSKQNHAKPITHEDPYNTTWLALKLLQQNPPILKQKAQSVLLNWAIENWQPEKLFKQTTLNHCVDTP